MNLRTKEALKKRKMIVVSLTSNVGISQAFMGNVVKSRIINLIVLLQIMITTFVSGHIYKQAYKILDGE